MALSDDLQAMGFSESRVSYAIAKLGKTASMEKALDFLDRNESEPTAEQLAELTAELEEGDEDGAPGGAAEAKSLKCLECNKVFRNNALASYHGEKSGHQNFEESTEEIKPLTAEEKAAKLDELKSRMSEKKKVNAKRDAEDAKANEAMRRKGGQDQSQIKADMELREVNKAALERAKDKIDDAKAKAAVRLQIEADKKTRAEKFAREKALRDGKDVPLFAGTSTAPTTSSAPAIKKSYDSARLQIRLPAGAPLVHSFPATATLGDVRDWVMSQTGETGAGVFSSTFPRKTYGESDMDKTVVVLGLAPSAVLMIA